MLRKVVDFLKIAVVAIATVFSTVSQERKSEKTSITEPVADSVCVSEPVEASVGYEFQF